MQILKKICLFYIDGFKNLTLGKVLWRVILIKLAVIFLFLKLFIYDKSLSDYGENKGAFVLDNLTHTSPLLPYFSPVSESSPKAHPTH